MTPSQTHWVSAFGRRVRLGFGSDPALRDDSLWRCREIYESALAQSALPQTGLAVDIGAGFGVFAIPFALAFPGWTVWCFEPQGAAFSALAANIAAHGLADRVIAVPVAVIGGTGSAATRATISAGNAAAVAKAARPERFLRDDALPMFLTADPDAGANPAFRRVNLPAIAAADLAGLSPDLLKLVAPGAEDAILEGFGAALPLRIIGESWQMLPSRLLRDHAHPDRHCFVPTAGQPFMLGQAPDISGRRPGLDVVVSLDDETGPALDSIAALLAGGDAELRVIAVDHGSGEGGAQIAARFGAHPQVTLVQSAGSNRAAARNAARLVSAASHIAFVDAGDLPEPALFPTLLDLARQTGAPVVQGSYDRVVEDENGQREFAPPDDCADSADGPRTRFGDASCTSLRMHDLIPGPASIWRRVYRRDFLDHHDIRFCETIGPADDLLFQILTLRHADTIYALDQPAYHRRQHAGEAAKLTDESAVLVLAVFRHALRRFVEEGWNEFKPVLEAFINVVNRSLDHLPPSLRAPYLDAAADLWVIMRKVLGDGPLGGLTEAAITDPGFARRVADTEHKLARFGLSYAWAYLDTPGLHPDIIHAQAQASAE